MKLNTYLPILMNSPGTRERRKYVVHIDIDAFFAAVEELLDPSLKGKPVIVGGLPHERGVASTANYEARRYGVHSGMPLRTAFQRCPNGVFLRGNYQIYSTFSRKFFAILFFQFQKGFNIRGLWCTRRHLLLH